MIYLVIVLVILLPICFSLGYIHKQLQDILKSIHHEEEAKPAEVIRTSPSIVNNAMPNEGTSYVVVQKTPQQIEKEEEAEIDNLVARS